MKKSFQLGVSFAMLVMGFMLFSRPVVWTQNLLTSIQRVVQVDSSNNFVTPSVDGTFDTTTQTTGPSGLVNGSTATPTGVSADGRNVQPWADRVGRMHLTGDASMAKLLVTPDSVALPANQSVNVAQMNGVTTSMNAGASDTGTQRVILADGLLEGPASGIVTTASTNATSVKGSAAQFFGYEIYNTTTTVYYLRLYNTSSAPTCSSATGFIRSIPIPPAGAAGQVGGAVSNQSIGVSYGTGLGYCITGGSSSTDNTNAAVGIFGTVKYR